MVDIGVVIAMLTAITVLAGVASRTGLPTPVVLVLGGLVMGFLPGPTPTLNANLVLLLFLPPLLYSSAYQSSTPELRANAGPIVLLATGLVFATVGAVAVVAHVLVGLPWAVAFVLGAVLGPTDAVAAGAVIRRLGAPPRIVTILEGESLVNDASAITAYAIAVEAVNTGSFDAAGAVGRFAAAVCAGVVIGLVVAWLANWVRESIPSVEVGVALSLLVPFVAYIPAEELTGSGVLGAVAAGLYLGARADSVSTASGRVQVAGFWSLLVFLVNATLFLLVGLQLPRVLDGIHGAPTVELIGEALAVTATVVAVRLGWMFAPRIVVAALRHGSTEDDATPAREVRPARLVLGWSAMRGAVSLAIAVGVPLTIAHDRPFPDRSELIFVSYVAVLVLLVVPAVTLGPLVRRLGLEQGAAQQVQLARARSELLHAALDRLDQLDVPPAAADRARGVYETRLARANAWLDSDTDVEQRHASLKSLESELITAQRTKLRHLRHQAAYPVGVLNRISRDLDLEEIRNR